MENNPTYNPVCPFGYEDCIWDPAYIKTNYPEWYAELYGDKTPEEVGCNPNSCFYDDEDK